MQHGLMRTLATGSILATVTVVSAQGQQAPAFKPHPSTQDPKRLVTIEKLQRGRKSCPTGAAGAETMSAAC